jgi:hypothetical protein
VARTIVARMMLAVNYGLIEVECRDVSDQVWMQLR